MKHPQKTSGLDFKTCVDLIDDQVTRGKRLGDHVTPVDILFTMRYFGVARMLFSNLAGRLTKKNGRSMPQRRGKIGIQEDRHY